MKKIKKIQIARIVIQILMLFLLPGLFMMAFSELKDIIKMIMSGNFNFLQALPSLMEFIIVAISTMLMGRVFCGWLCAFGAYNDFIYLASKKIFKTKFRMDPKIDSYLKYVKYGVLLVIIFVGCILGSNVLSSASPWNAFAQITDFSNILMNMPIGLLLLLLITIGAFFVERFFCRYLCPLGAFFSLISRVSFLKIRKPSDKCGMCRICTNNCSMGLKLYETENVHGGDCINCFKCIEACPRKNTRINILGEDMNPALASSVAIATFIGIYGATNLAGYVANQISPAPSQSVAFAATKASTQKYKDGTYTGTGTGFRGGTTDVEVTISNGKVININTTLTQDTPRFYNYAFDNEANAIISSQSTDVDTVSGATFSSQGIISAVQDALSKAANSNVTDNTSGSTASSVGNGNTSSTSNSSDDTATSKDSGSSGGDNSSSTQENKSTASSTAASSSSPTTQQGKYKDGTYTGAGKGFRGGTTELSVTISNGIISGIETLSTRDTPRFYNYCEQMLVGEILSSQSTSVDTVSGATYSSRGIISAVNDALSQAANP